MTPTFSFSPIPLLAAAADHVQYGPAIGISLPGLLVLAIAVGFLIYVFTGSSRLVAGVLFCGLLVLLGAGFLRSLRHGPARPARLVELAPPRQAAAEPGLAATTSLFEVTAQGHSFVYVIDGTASMGTGDPNSPLEALKEPLKQSIVDLQRNHLFQVCVFDSGTSMHIPAAPTNHPLVVADNHNVVLALESIDHLTAGTSRENPERFAPGDALFQALSSQPDVIYFLTDGQGKASASDLNSIRRWNSSRTALHVIQLTADAGAPRPQWLADLARDHRGVFKQVIVTPRPAEKEPGAKRPATTVAKSPAARQPEWLAYPPQPLEQTGQGVYKAVVSSGFSKGEERSRENLDRELLAVTAGYIDLVVEPGAGRRVTQDPSARERALQYLSTNVIKERHREEVQEEYPIDEGIKQHALLVFTPQAAEHFRQEWRMILQERRLLLFAAAVAVLLGIVGTIFGYLKTDTATRGYYTGRLRLAAGVMIIGLIAGAVALFMQA